MKQTSQKQRKQMAAKLGSQGGRAIVRKRGKAYMSKLAKLGGVARWKNRNKHGIK